MKLERLGYYLHPECIDDDRGNYLFVNREYYLNRPLGYSEELSRSIDCGTNEDLFLAIAALRDDTDNNQMFINGKGDWGICRDGSDGGLEGLDFYGMPNDLNVDNYHKATVEELIEHFKGKGVNHG
nr:MAG TPA: hypothetical protein [Caudoviricetes sp.]